MKKILFFALFVFGCDGLQALELQVPGPGTTQKIPEVTTVLDAPRPNFMVSNHQTVRPVPLQGPGRIPNAWLSCASEGHRIDFTGRIFTMGLEIGMQRPDFTGIIDAVVTVATSPSGSGLSFSPVNESASIHLRGFAELDELTFTYQPREDRELSDETGHLNSFFLSQSTTIHLRETSEGNYAGTLNNHSLFDSKFNCWAADKPRVFDYNPQNGRCENANGEQGFNPSSLIKVRHTADGQCVDMAGWALNGEDFSYPNLAWDVRGAHLNGATISFADMIGADFRGTKMDSFSYGYTTLKGKVDQFTQLPSDCTPQAEQIDCLR
jgi:hypothetical protein